MNLVKHIHKGSLERFFNLLLIAFIYFMTLKGGTSGACAACKYQRRRCAPDCKLAPYFPAENPKLFQNVHRLFGVRSIVKILENLDEAHQSEAMKSIIYEAYVRDKSPVLGCLGVTQQLQYSVWLAEEELKAVNSQLQFYRSQQQNGQNHNHNHSHNQLDLGMGLPVNNNQSNVVTPFFSPLSVSETQQPHMSYAYSCGDVNNNGYSTPAYRTNSGKEILTNYNNLWGDQNRFTHNNKNGGGFSNQNEMKMESNHQQEEEEEDAHEYDEIHQFLEMIDEKQSSFADTKEAYASSSGQSLKEPSDEIGENELRSAATCFRLTRLN